MDSKERQAFIATLRQIIEQTRSGAMVWKKINPTAYSWSGNGGQILLQQVSKTIRSTSGTKRELKSYVIHVLDQSNTSQLTVNSTEIEQTSEILRDLFDAIGASFAKKGVDFLSAIVAGSKDR